LCDGDLGLANIDIQLGLTPEKDLTNSLMHYIELKNIIIPYPQGEFDVIVGRSGSGTLATLPPQNLIYLREQLKKLSSTYDVVLVDLGAGVGTTIQTLMQIAGQCIVIITDEPTSLMDAYAFIKVMHGRRQTLPMNVIINQAETLEAGKRTYETIQQVCEKFLKMTPNLLGIIRRDPFVRNTICAQEPILIRYPNAPAAEDVKAIIQTIVE
jgi:flagellar biosynthesis protein FlhG